MPPLIRFLRDAGKFGAGSVLLASILLGITIHEHLTGKGVSAFWLEILVVVFFCFGAAAAWKKEYKGRLSAEQALDKANQALSARKDRPKLDIKIDEVIVDPLVRSAECFVRVSVHNSVKEAATNICAYRFSLVIDGASFCSSQPLPLDGFSLAHWEDDEEQPWISHKHEDEPLSKDDFLMAVGKEPLKQGNRRGGWLRFTLTDLPMWPSHQEPTGHPYFDQSEDDPAGTWREEESTIFETTNVTAALLEVCDAFGFWHSGKREAPLCARTRTVINTEV